MVSGIRPMHSPCKLLLLVPAWNRAASQQSETCNEEDEAKFSSLNVSYSGSLHTSGECNTIVIPSFSEAFSIFPTIKLLGALHFILFCVQER
jgi:hypothetical protein